ncbi:hypothetical protein AVEN_124361-1 [Araneus ventricosus]|uniref:GAG-pre-integrase domain-containing protein n=1 Tax=Araneus ventricosus TaxID=182803 RepID=A0A4Y2FGZ0_ARAVE|nr:hypothetical protein AVEN_124361-1 [Araneus ventricosus]
MRRNLICGVQINIVGNFIEWGRDKMIAYNAHKEYLLTINRVDKLYIAYDYPTKSEAKFKDVALVSNLKLDFGHRRFCHVNMPLVESMSKNNSVKGNEHLTTTKHPDTSLSSDSGSRSEESSNSDEAYKTLEYECYNSELPRSLEDTQRSKEKENWDITMKEELKIMETHRVWELVDSPADETIIGSK